ALCAAGAAAQAARDTRHEQVAVPLRPDAELWDTVSLSCDATLVPPASALRHVTRIIESYSAARGVFRSELWLTAH
ncbi:MAG: hypothetical protein GX557_06235, partial [Chloroflexi bacterium]|nr:hypothetical protein [Chloroflexota bacterium]